MCKIEAFLEQILRSKIGVKMYWQISEYKLFLFKFNYFMNL